MLIMAVLPVGEMPERPGRDHCEEVNRPRDAQMVTYEWQPVCWFVRLSLWMENILAEDGRYFSWGQGSDELVN